MEHQFNIHVAQQFGIEEAVIIHHLFHWISKNAANEQNEFEGLYWTYNSIKAYAVIFPYMSETKMKRVFKNLEDKKFIVKGRFNEDKWDKTNWYSFPIESLCYLKSVGYDVHWFKMNHSIGSKCTNREEQNEPMLIINYTDSKPSNKEEDTNVSPKKNDYQAIVDCWNECNGAKLGKVLKLTDKRKKAIKKQLDDNGITQEQLMMFFKSLPFADSWLYNPNKQHQNWKPDFDWWMTNTNGWLTKAFEGKVHKENPQAFVKIMHGDEEQLSYTPNGRTIWFNEDTKSYWTTDPFYDGCVSDGYDDENRPDGATLTLNNARGDIRWSSTDRKWNKE